MNQPVRNSLTEIQSEQIVDKAVSSTLKSVAWVLRYCSHLHCKQNMQFDAAHSTLRSLSAALTWLYLHCKAYKL